MKNLRALSINQPWAWAIVYGGKRIENRKWKTSFRGDFWIHAGLRYDKEGEEWIDTHFPELEIRTYLPNGKRSEEAPFKMGGIIAKATMVDCVDRSESPWFFGPYGFVLENVRDISTYIPCRGMLNFFKPKIEWFK